MPPSSAAQLLAEAQRRYRAGDLARAAQLVTDSLAQDPDQPAVLELAGMIYNRTAHFDRAEDVLTRGLGVVVDPVRRTRLLHNLACTLLSTGREREALAHLEQALALAPDDAGALGTKAEALLYVGRAEEARSLLDDAIARGVDELGIALAYAHACQRTGDFAPAIERLRAHTERVGLSAEQLAMASHRLGELLDKTQSHDEAFDAFRRAARLARQAHDPDDVSRAVDTLIAGWTPGTIASVKRTPDTTEQPVFVVGMPRSGTSLLEQILDCHPDVCGAGELETLGNITRALPAGVTKYCYSHVPRPAGLKAKPLARAGGRYLAELRAGVPDPDALRLVDKQPLNTFQLGLVPLLFPNARVIFCRRDPMDTCLSCYFQRFAPTHTYANDLTDLARFFTDHHRLSEHWLATFAHPKVGLDALVVRYESLVTDPEAQTSRVLDFLGLPFDDACLRFHESGRLARTLSNQQVRQPLYTASIGRWKHYRSHLRELADALGPLAT